VTGRVCLKGLQAEYGPRLESAPANLVYVGRHQGQGGWDVASHPLHNPHDVGKKCRRKACGGVVHTLDESLSLYREHMTTGPYAPYLTRLLPPLRGYRLACWCPLDQRCHVDVLLELIG
jgi:hypothetical protein